MRRNFGVLYNKVRSCRVTKNSPLPGTAERICASVEKASIWYWKRVLCLQRSAATVCLLRKHGIPAQMVIGAQRLPFKAHAWVEVEGHVVNDKSYTAAIYALLDRC
jgi:Transglutaminase-like superfamily